MWEYRGFVDLMPLSVVSEQTKGNDHHAEVWQEESAHIVNATPERRAEFATTRQCARRALQRLGFPPVAIPVQPSRAPAWPAGVVGSLTHGADLRAAAVATTATCRAVGIDVEPNDGLPNGTLELIASPVEISGLRALDSLWPKVAWDRLLFSAKEAIFKAWFPMTGHWLNYHECTLTIESDTATFTGRLHLDSSIRAHFGIDMVEGRWGISKGRLLSAVVVPTRADQ